MVLWSGDDKIAILVTLFSQYNSAVSLTLYIVYSFIVLCCSGPWCDFEPCLVICMSLKGVEILGVESEVSYSV